MISEWKDKRKFYKYLWAVNTDKAIFYIGNENDNFSPYIEANTEFINDYCNSDYFVLINPYIRFNNIFKCYGIKVKPNVELENNIFQILRAIDYIRGNTIVRIICENIEKDIINEIYGEEVKKKYNNIGDIGIKENILLHIYRSLCNEITDRRHTKYKYKKYLKYYFLVINSFFENNIVYKMANNDFEYVVFLNYSKNRDNVNLLSLLEDLFLPLEGNNIKYYWKNHFNVIEVRSVAKIEKNTVF